MASSELSEIAVRDAARRAYELARLQGAAFRGAVAGLLALPGLLLCHRTPFAAFCLGAFALVVAAGYYAGRAYSAGVLSGAFAGIVPCLLPAAIAAAGGNHCAPLFADVPWPCAAGGLVAGAILGWRSRAASGPAFWSSAIVALGLAASLGCIPAGVMGFAGLALGVVAGGAPAFAIRRALS